MLEPVHYVRLCLDRELSADEFNSISGIVVDTLGDLVEDNEVIMHERDGQYCYIYTLNNDIVSAGDGTSLGDTLSADIDDILGDTAWELEGSLPDQEVEVPDNASESQVQEAAIRQVQNFLFG